MRFTVALAMAVLAAAPPAAAEEGWAWPVEGRVLTPYSNDNTRPYAGGMHRGIDIAAAVGAPVVAARAGTVTHGGVVGSSGLVVSVRTGDGRHVTSYLHLSSLGVDKGDAVAAGARLGAVGTSGRRSAAEPHLHFGVRLADRDDHYLDPLSLLPPLSAPDPAPAAPPLPAPVPVRAAPQPVPVPVAAAPRAQGAPVPAGARARPRGTLQPGPAAVRVPAAVPRAAPALGGAPARRARHPRRVPPAGAPVRSRAPAALPRPAPAAASERSFGRPLALGGLGLIGLVLFGGVAWRTLGRANAGVNSRAARAARSIRDRLRIGPSVRRLPSP